MRMCWVYKPIVLKMCQTCHFLPEVLTLSAENCRISRLRSCKPSSRDLKCLHLACSQARLNRVLVSVRLQQSSSHGRAPSVNVSTFSHGMPVLASQSSVSRLAFHCQGSQPQPQTQHPTKSHTTPRAKTQKQNNNNIATGKPGLEASGVCSASTPCRVIAS